MESNPYAYLAETIIGFVLIVAIVLVMTYLFSGNWKRYCSRCGSKLYWFECESGDFSELTGKAIILKKLICKNKQCSYCGVDAR